MKGKVIGKVIGWLLLLVSIGLFIYGCCDGVSGKFAIWGVAGIPTSLVILGGLYASEEEVTVGEAMPRLKAGIKHIVIRDSKKNLWQAFLRGMDSDMWKVLGAAIALILIPIGCIPVLSIMFWHSPYHKFGFMDIFLLLILGACILGGFFLIWFSTEYARKEIGEYLKAKRHAADVMSQLKAGTYNFPSAKFYRLCESSSLSTFDDPISRKKAVILVDKVLDEEVSIGRIPDEYRKQYYEAAGKLYQEGKEVDKAEKEAKISAEENAELERQKRPIRGSIPKKYAEVMSFHSNYSGCSPEEKTHAILTKRYEETKARLYGGPAAVEAVSGLIASSYTEEKKSDWAVLGGMASAIAGPAAGVAVAADTMRKNAEIDARNAENRKRAEELSAQLRASTYIPPEYRDIVSSSKENEMNFVKAQLEALKLKLILTDIPTAELFSALTVNTSAYTNNDSSCTYFSLSVANHYEAAAKSSLRMAIDGSLHAKLYCDDGILIGEADLALPCHGVSSGREITVEGIVPAYMIGDHENYRVEVTPKQLWLAEV